MVGCVAGVVESGDASGGEDFAVVGEGGFCFFEIGA